MKKTLSLLLVLAMVLSSFSFAFAAEAEKTPGEVLKDLGVLTGNAKGDLMLEDELSRQDMIVLLSRVLGQEDEAKAFKGEMSFTDVNDSFYKPYIAWAEANKLTNGVEEAKFGFGRPVTEQEVATFMLRALGYNDVKWEDVPAKAAELKLVDAKADLTVNCKRARMAEITLAALGTKMNGSEKTLAESLGLELPKPAKLEVKEVVADNLKEIKVVFNKDVDAESATNMDNYEFDDAEIVDITYNENMVILLLDEKLDNKEDYEITIDGIKDLEKVTKEFTVYDNTIPTVENVVALGTKAIKVTMSEPIKSVDIGDFKLDGKTIYGSVELPVVGREVVIKPYKVLDAKEYELSVGKLEDFAGFKSVESKHTFEVVEDKEKPTVVDVKATLESAVITFSEDIDKATVSRYNVYHGAKVYPEDAVKIAGNKVLVVFTAEKALPVYENTLYVSGFADYSGNKMDAAEIKVKPSIDESRPEVMKTELQKDLRTIEVKFSKTVSKTDAEKISNYTVLDPKDNKLTISEAKLQDNGRVVEVVLGKKLDENKEYTLKISDIRDNNKYPNVMFAYEGKISVGDVSLPEVKYVSGSHGTADKDGIIESTIYVFFNKEMDLATLSNPENYLVEMNSSNKLLSDVKGEVDVIKSDGTVVVLTVKSKYTVNKIGVLGVKDTTGKKLDNYGVMFTVDTKTFALDKGVAKAKNTIELTFNMSVKEAPAGAFEVVGNSEAKIKEVDINDNVVKITLTDNKLAASKTNVVKIAADKVVAYNGKALGEKDATKEVTLADKIAPSMLKVTADNFVKGGKEVVLTVKFDEDIKGITMSPIPESWKTDLVVLKIEGDDEIADYKLERGNYNSELKLTIDVSEIGVDTAFEVGINSDGARFITDENDNAAKVMKVRTDKKVTGITDTIKDAVTAINAATSETIATVLSANADVLGLDLTDYTALTTKTSVHTALVGKSFADAAAVKTAFDKAVAEQKVAEQKALEAKTPASATLTATPTEVTVDTEDHDVTVSVEVKNSKGEIITENTAGTYTVAVPAGAEENTDYVFDVATGKLTIKANTTNKGDYTITYTNTAEATVTAEVIVTVK